MITRAQKVRLGVFIAVATALLVGTLAVVAGLQVASERDTYVVRYAGLSMSGLEPGASVKYNGVRVGRVDALRIDRDNVSEVVVTLSLEKGTPVKKDTRAIVNLAGITGLKFIELTGGTSKSEFVQPGGEIEGGESTLDRLTGRAEAIAEKAELLLNQLNKAVSDENRERVMKVVDDVELLLAENRENVAVITGNLRDASDGLATVLKNLEREGTAALVAVRQVAEGVREGTDKGQVARIAQNVERVTASLRATVEQADMPTTVKAIAGAAHRMIENIDMTVVRSREDLFASLSYLLEGLENFSEFARSIRENPSLLFSSRREQEREGP
ncbi:MAG: MCE family protein [Deltaproteobacteria bacterium]|nr:MCE family protein [Deltaproteobacteria bacterium]